MVGLTGADVRRMRLRAQLLGDQGRAMPVGAVLSAVGGIQAQDLAAAAMSIRARSPDLAISDLASALAAREAVLTWTLRGTRHLHPAGDIRGLVSLFGPVNGQPGRRARQLGIDGDVGDRAVSLVAEALRTGGTLTRAEIKDLLAPLGIDVSGQAPVHVLFRAAMEGVLCVVPDPLGPKGIERYALLDGWVPPSQHPPPGRRAGLAHLARRYLTAFGPATPLDFRAWSGLPARLAQEAWASLAGHMVRLEAPNGPLWMLADRYDEVMGAADERDPEPLRLLGGFDALLLGYADRSLLMAPDRARDVNAGGGMVKPVVLVDGWVAGTWRYRRGTGAHRIDVTPFQPLDPAHLSREVAAVGRFVGAEVVLTIA